MRIVRTERKGSRKSFSVMDLTMVTFECGCIDFKPVDIDNFWFTDIRVLSKIRIRFTKKFLRVFAIKDSFFDVLTCLFYYWFMKWDFFSFLLFYQFFLDQWSAARNSCSQSSHKNDLTMIRKLWFGTKFVFGWCLSYWYDMNYDEKFLFLRS